jgi:hypothetical protein
MPELPDADRRPIPKAVLASLDQVYAMLDTLPEPHHVIKDDIESILAQILARVQTWHE